MRIKNLKLYKGFDRELRWPKWAIAKVFSKSRKKFSSQEKSLQIKKKVFTIKNTQTRSRTRKHDQEHANTIKNTQTRSKTRNRTIEISFQNREKIFENKKEHTQLITKENYNLRFCKSICREIAKRRFEMLY